MKTWHGVALALGAFLFLSGCVSLGAHRSARPVGKKQMEVGFSFGYSNLSAFGVVQGNVGELGAAEGFLRYGLTNSLDFSVAAGSIGVTPRLDWSFLHRKRLNMMVGVGLGMGLAVLEVNGDSFLGGATVAPDLTALVSFGGPAREFTLGLRLLKIGGAGMVSNAYLDSAEYDVSDRTGSAIGTIVSYTRRGKRLNVTPELDLYFGTQRIGAAVGQFGFLVIPSVTFSMVK